MKLESESMRLGKGENHTKISIKKKVYGILEIEFELVGLLEITDIATTSPNVCPKSKPNFQFKWLGQTAHQ